MTSTFHWITSWIPKYWAKCPTYSPRIFWQFRTIPWPWSRGQRPWSSSNSVIRRNGPYNRSNDSSVTIPHNNLPIPFEITTRVVNARQRRNRWRSTHYMAITHPKWNEVNSVSVRQLWNFEILKKMYLRKFSIKFPESITEWNGWNNCTKKDMVCLGEGSVNPG